MLPRIASYSCPRVLIFIVCACKRRQQHLGWQYVECCPGLVKTPVPFDVQALAALSVDAVTPQTNYLPSVANISAVQQAGRQVWTYISVQPCVPIHAAHTFCATAYWHSESQVICGSIATVEIEACWCGRCNHCRYKPYQDWRLDNPLIDNRALFWLVRSFGFDGLLHWGVNQWGGDSSLKPISTQTDGFIQPSEWNMATSPGSWMQVGNLAVCCAQQPRSTKRLHSLSAKRFERIVFSGASSLHFLKFEVRECDRAMGSCCTVARTLRCQAHGW